MQLKERSTVEYFFTPCRNRSGSQPHVFAAFLSNSVVLQQPSDPPADTEYCNSFRKTKPGSIPAGRFIDEDVTESLSREASHSSFINLILTKYAFLCTKYIEIFLYVCAQFRATAPNVVCGHDVYRSFIP
jgi:hypothetical protein